MYGFIYITTNHVNGKRYIGQKKYDKNGKWKKYLGSGIALKNAISKYGENNFSKEIIEECETKEKLDEREIFWINCYDATNNKDFYNIASGGDGGNTIQGFDKDRLNKLKKTHSELTKQSHKNNNFTYKLTEDIVVNVVIPRLINNEFNSDIANDLNVSCGTIDDIRHHRTWKRFTEGIIFDDISERKRGMKAKTVTQYSLNGEKLNTYKNAVEAGNSVNADSKMIMDVCSGNKRQCRGYIWRYDDEDFNKYDVINHACVKIDKYSMIDGRYICTYDSIIDANKSIKSGDVRLVLNGKAKSAGGYFWCRNGEIFIMPKYNKSGRKPKKQAIKE